MKSFSKRYKEIQELIYEYLSDLVMEGTAGEIINCIKGFNCDIDHDGYFIDLCYRNDLQLILDIEKEIFISQEIKDNAYEHFSPDKYKYYCILKYLHPPPESSTHQNS